MKRFKQFLKKNCAQSLVAMAALALFVGSTSASVASVWWFHQPEMPESIRNHKR